MARPKKSTRPSATAKAPGRPEPPSFAFEPVATRVLAELSGNKGTLSKITTIVAPTGYGKTVLATSLFQHFSEGEGACLWLSLDEPGLSVDRFQSKLEQLISAKDSSRHPTLAIIDGDVSMQNRIDNLVEAMAALPDPTVLIIDNLGYCDDETLGPLLDQIVFRTPPEIRFVLVSASQVPLNLARARLEGMLREFTAQELSLQLPEIRSLLGKPLCRKIGSSGVETIAQRTEGWPAAVRLAQIVLAAADDPNDALAQFSGSDRDLSELLNRQVLEGFDDAAHAFLLKLALLKSFCVDLAREALESDDAGIWIEQLIERNVFVIPLDRNRRWYRLHSLFREFLLGEAARVIGPDPRREILVRAARWSEAEGRSRDAVNYALEAGATELASQILERIAPTYVRDHGDLRQYLDWIETVRERGQAVGWEAEFWYVWGLIFYRRYEYARQQNEQLLQRLNQAAVDADLAEQRDSLRRRFKVIGVCVDAYTDRLDAALRNADDWLAQRGADDPFDVATLACASAISLNASLKFAEAHERMRIAQEAINQSGSDYGAGWVVAVRSLILIQEGAVDRARKELSTALTRATRSLGSNCAMVGTLSTMLAKCAVEMGHDDEARERLPTGLRWAHAHGIGDTAILGIDAALKLWNGEDADTISELREIASSYPPRVTMMMSCLLVQRLLRLGRIEDAKQEAVSIGIGPLARDRTVPAELAMPRAQELHAAAEIDLLVALGQLRRAEDRIKEQSQLARNRGGHARLTELALAEMTVAVCSHNPEPAARHLVRAIGFAAKRGILRPFKDRLDVIAGVVNDTKPQAWGFALAEERQFFAQVCRMLPTGTSLLADELEQVRGDGKLLETPTSRELELLGLIEAGLSNQQLADRLNVSVATVKWHLYNLYTKLGVSSRSAALARAKALNLLSR